MRNAPTALTADYDNGKASFTMKANMEQAYKTVYSNYHTPAGTDPKQAPFRLELRYDSAVEPIHLQVYLDTEKEAFTISDYAIAPAAYTRTYTVTLQANEGTKDAPELGECSSPDPAVHGGKESFRAHGDHRPGSE